MILNVHTFARALDHMVIPLWGTINLLNWYAESKILKKDRLVLLIFYTYKIEISAAEHNLLNLSRILSILSTYILSKKYQNSKRTLRIMEKEHIEKRNSNWEGKRGI